MGAERVEAACQAALDAEAVNVDLVARMLERAKEAEEHSADADAPKNVVAGRFSREPPSSRPRGRRNDLPRPLGSPELRALLRRLRLGQVIDTLPERAVLAKASSIRTSTSWPWCWPMR